MSHQGYKTVLQDFLEGSIDHSKSRPSLKYDEPPVAMRKQADEARETMYDDGFYGDSEQDTSNTIRLTCRSQLRASNTRDMLKNMLLTVANRDVFFWKSSENAQEEFEYLMEQEDIYRHSPNNEERVNAKKALNRIEIDLLERSLRLDLRDDQELHMDQLAHLKREIRSDQTPDKDIIHELEKLPSYLEFIIDSALTIDHVNDSKDLYDLHVDIDYLQDRISEIFPDNPITVEAIFGDIRALVEAEVDKQNKLINSSRALSYEYAQDNKRKTDTHEMAAAGDIEWKISGITVQIPKIESVLNNLDDKDIDAIFDQCIAASGIAALIYEIRNTQQEKGVEEIFDPNAIYCRNTTIYL